MRYILILLLFCSCASTFSVNGVELKQRVRPVSESEKPIYITAFLIGTAVSALYVRP